MYIHIYLHIYICTHIHVYMYIYMHVYHMRVRVGSMVALEVRETIGKTGHAKGPQTLLFLYLKIHICTCISCVLT